MAVGDGAGRGAKNGGERGGLLRRGADDVAAERMALRSCVIALNSRNRMQALGVGKKNQTLSDAGRSKKVADGKRQKIIEEWKLDGEGKRRSGKR